MDEDEILLEIIRDLFGKEKHYYASKGQISINCPYCDEGRNKGNLEININESEDSHKAFQDHHNIAAKHIKGITKALSSHYDNVTNNKNYNKGEAQWHHVSAIKNINRALEDLHQNIAQEVDYSRPPKPLKEEADYFEDDLTDLLNTIYEHLSDENKQIFDEIIDHDPNQLVDFLEALEIEYGQ